VKSKFAKDHLLSRHDSINEALSQEVGNKVISIAPQDTAVGKAYNRLLSSKVLAAEVSSLCRALHELLDPGAKHIAENGALNVREETKAVMSGKTKSSELVAITDLDSDSHLAVDKVTRWESGMETDDHFDATNEELSSSSEEGDSKYPQIENMEDDDDYSVVNKSVQSAAKPSGVESTFLPSLSVGFIRGSDESDWSGDEAPVADPSKRKNRRGQRARRAYVITSLCISRLLIFLSIWEKKYGRNANHKKRELEALPKRQFPEESRNLRRGPEQRLRKRGDIFGGSTTSNSVPRSEDSHQRTNKREERPLHPSWAAKRQMKEKQTLGIVPSQGTKIKFTD
jgi:hypothetical protein